MATYTDRVEKSVTHYEPGPLPSDPESLGVYTVDELKRLGNVLLNQATFRLERTNVVPDKPRPGDIRYFDGTNADPVGNGIEGLYVYKKGSHWVNVLALDEGTVEITGASGDLALEIDNNVANSANLKIRCDAGSLRSDFYVDNQVHITLKGQRVGILDTSPTYTLDVFGDGRFVQQLTVDAGIACADTVVSRPRLTAYAETVNAIGSITSGTNADLEDGNVQSVTMTANTFNFGITNALASHSNSLTLIVTNGGLATVTWLSGAHGGGGNAVQWAGGTAPTLTNSGTDILCFTTFNGGTNWYGFAAAIELAAP